MTAKLPIPEYTPWTCRSVGGHERLSDFDDNIFLLGVFVFVLFSMDFKGFCEGSLAYDFIALALQAFQEKNTSNQVPKRFGLRAVACRRRSEELLNLWSFFVASLGIHI